jgi:NAD(P)-dependent dehydrogenase (short-subunit alcohol dehydrogenase family)
MTDMRDDLLSPPDSAAYVAATDMAAKHAASYTPPSLRGVLAPEKILKAVHALGRRAEPSEIASIAAFLLSEDASYITGATIDASGGRI